MAEVQAPVPGPDDAFFWEGAARHQLLLQHCGACGLVRMPPGPMCPACHSVAWEAREASGRGRVHSWIVSRHPTEPDALPRIVVLVELAEGVRLVSNLLCELDEVAAEMPVEVTFRDYGGVTLPQFVPVPA
jgi:uncharacterized OB-fold protein